MRRSKIRGGVCAAMLLGAALASPVAAQVTIAVNSTAQEVTLAQPNGIANGNCTLGEAILAANARNVVDGCNGTSAAGTMVTLDLLAGTYTFDRVGKNVAFPGSVTSPFALPEITQSTTIRGNGAILRRPATPGTPAMGLLVLSGDGTVFRASSMRLEGGVRGLGFAQSPPGTIASIGISLQEFRLTDVVVARPLGVAFNASVTSVARLERVTFSEVDLRTTRSTLGGAGLGPVAIEVLDSEFADGRGGLSIQPGIDATSTTVLVSGSRFLRNRGFAGAGLRISSNQPGLQVTLTGNQFIDNTGSDGGAIDIVQNGSGVPAVIASSNNLFRGNVASGNGGALRIATNDAQGYRFSSIGDTFERNAATDGAGLRFEGNVAEPVLIDRATFRDNAANTAAAISFAGTHVATPRRAMRITRSTFTGNTDTAGTVNLIGVFSPGHRVQIDNSTVDGNFANARLLLGGSTDNALDAEALTITGNSARFAIDALSAGATLRNTVITGNFLTSACGTQLGGSITNAGGLFVQDATCNAPARTENPLLGPLAVNDGSTLNRLPLAGSPLLNVGVAPVLEPLFDQRGLQRVRFGATDIGAVESDSPVIFLSGFEPAN